MQISQLLAQLETAAVAQQQHNYAHALTLYEELLAAVPLQNATPEMRQLRVKALNQSARIHYLQGNQEQALKGYQQAYLESTSSRQAVAALVQIGDQHVAMGNYDKALQAQNEALHLAESLNDSSGRAHALRSTGLVYMRMGRFGEAIASLRKALSLFQQLHDRPERTRTWNLIGIAHAQKGELDKAIDAFVIGLADARHIGDVATASFLGNLGEAHQDLYDMEQALIYHREGLQIAQQMHLSSQEVDLWRNLGVDLFYLGEIDESGRSLQKALQLSQETGLLDMELQTLYSLALVALAQQQTAVAAAYTQRLQTAVLKAKARGHEARVCYLLGLCAQQNGDSAKAEQQWQQALFLAHETDQKHLLWQIHAALAQVATNPELAQTHNRIAAEVIEQIIYPLENEALCQIFRNAPPVKAVLSQVAR